MVHRQLAGNGYGHPTSLVLGPGALLGHGPFERVVFLDPLVAGGVTGQPEVLVYAEADDGEREPFCVPLLAIPEDLAPNRHPDERHLIRGAAQCLLLERAYKLPVDLGVLQFRNRVVSFVMTVFARERTEEVLDEIRCLQAHNN